MGTGNVNRSEFLRKFESTLEEPLEPGTLTGDELCEDIDGWNSLATLAFISMLSKDYNVVIKPEKIFKCKKVDEIIDLVASAVEQNPARA
jgi:acyl carrier protein